MQSIVVGIDREMPSRTALDWVVERTGLVPVSVRLITVVGDGPFRSRRAERDLAAAARRLAAALPATPVDAKLVAGTGIADVLAREAADADLLVVGHHRKRRMRSLFAGALPEQLANHATCPVVIVPNDWLRRFGKVVVGFAADGSSDAALEFAAREAHASGRSLDIVQINAADPHPGSSILLGSPDDASERSAQLANAVEIARTGRASLAVRTFSVEDDPDRVLHAHGRDAALVVIGSHEHTTLDAVVRGARAYEFMNVSTAPLCVVPAGWRAKNLVGAP